MSDELTPITRKETFLAKAGGQNVVTPTPITREETFLQAIIDNGAGGGGGGGALLKVGITVESGTATMNKTYAEIASAYENGFVFAHTINPNDGTLELSIVDWMAEHEGMYGLGLHSIELGNTSIFIASSTDGYPVCSDF